MYTLIFLSLIVSAWLLLGFLPWLCWSVATRGNAGLGMLPLCLFAALIGGLAVPLLGKDDGAGMLWSAFAALAASASLLAARRLSSVSDRSGARAHDASDLPAPATKESGER